MITFDEMCEYGYTWEGMKPLDLGEAINLFRNDFPIYALHKDGSESLMESEFSIQMHSGLFGIEV